MVKRYTIKHRAGTEYLSGRKASLTKQMGSFENKETARKVFLKTVRKQQPIAKKMSDKKLLRLIKIVRRK